MPVKLHIGSGPIVLPGWINIDNKSFNGVDRVLDVRAGIPYRDVEAIFAEHFIEHLTLSEGEAFLRECRAVLTPSGVLRLTTPNFDWVWASHYRPPETLSPELALVGCLEINRAFHAWGHKFLYNFTTLAELLRHSGFKNVVIRAYGQSDLPELRNLEQHEVTPGLNKLESLLIVEATGHQNGVSRLPGILEPYLKDFDAP